MGNKYNEYPFLRKVVIIFTVLWTVACSSIYVSMRHSPRSTRFYVLLGVVPIAIAWALAMSHRWILAMTALTPELEQQLKEARRQRKKPG